jgi:hypothetical protein
VNSCLAPRGLHDQLIHREMIEAADGGLDESIDESN